MAAQFTTPGTPRTSLAICKKTRWTLKCFHCSPPLITTHNSRIMSCTMSCPRCARARAQKREKSLGPYRHIFLRLRGLCAAHAVRDLYVTWFWFARDNVHDLNISEGPHNLALTLKNRLSALTKHPDFNAGRISHAPWESFWPWESFQTVGKENFPRS